MRLNELQLHRLIKGMAHCLNSLQRFFSQILPSQHLTWEPVPLACYCLFYFFKQIRGGGVGMTKRPTIKAAKTDVAYCKGKAGGVH